MKLLLKIPIKRIFCKLMFYMLFQAPKPENLIDGYKVEYQRILEMDVHNHKYGDRQTVTVPALQTWHIVTRLRANSWYELRVCAYNGNVQSRYSAPVLMQTEPVCE